SAEPLNPTDLKRILLLVSITNFVGIPSTLKASTTLLSISINTWKGYALFSMNAATFFFTVSLSPFSQVSINTNLTFLSSLYFSTACFIPGNEALQGPHQVAQKSTTTTLPFSEASVTSLPCMSFKVND